MMQMITRFIELSKIAVDRDINIETIGELKILRRLMRMGEEIGEEELDKFSDLRIELDAAFTHLTGEAIQETASDES